MIRLLESFGVVQNDEGEGFRLGSAIMMSLLILLFVGSSIYVLISSMNS